MKKGQSSEFKLSQTWFKIRGENCRENSWTYFEDLHFLQDQLLSLQVISGQDDDFLNCPLVCGWT